jgi:hypothetical protein
MSSLSRMVNLMRDMLEFIMKMDISMTLRKSLKRIPHITRSSIQVITSLIEFLMRK